MGGTGGDRRSFEVLQRVEQHGVDPVIAVDDFVLKKMKSEANPLCRHHKIYSIKRPNVVYDRSSEVPAEPRWITFQFMKPPT